MSMPNEWKTPTNAVAQSGDIPQSHVAPATPQSAAATTSVVISSIIAAALLVLAEGVGIFITVLAEMTTDGCGSDGSCNFAALDTAMGCAAFGPLVIPAVVLGIYIFRKVKKSGTDSTGSDHIAGVLWLAVVGDVLLLFVVMVLLGMVDPSS